MKAIAIEPGTTNVALIDVDEPQVSAPDEVKIKMLQVGICGTDREEVSGGRADVPPGEKKLIIGHEMFGQVVDTGSAVTKVKKGDYGVFMVRRGCGQCKACLAGRSDMCYTGAYTERGIKGANGFQAQYVVDKERYLVKVPAEIKEIGVLTEPMSVAAKAIDEALIIQKARLQDFEKEESWLEGKKALVAGIGAIGLMAAFALRLRGATVVGLDVVDEGTRRPQLLKKIGGTYVDGRSVPVTSLDEVCGEVDFIFEATGVAEIEFELIDVLGTNGIYVATGIPGGNRPLTLEDASLMKQLVLKNGVMLGSVNASLHHFEVAVEDLAACLEKWPDEIRAVITERILYENFDAALHNHSADEIKVTVQWSEPDEQLHT
ncbi:glucose 1-dehydrogenase [Flavisolibacter nicotianae]|uniref:glucose 1-dehydrogenase n=1 Tax=Flavisolibacter nicotianae TaxID=2364882 RepID=UPI000EAB9AC7|nr:glucose 1-dehydrogenase [Flavisolibacter nicotianae]